ncbi:hypothetical protein OWV82_021103 [Melia azedarach]|uniref:Uncharacterized protein n=1 Tax=Melia azedarach TaxID=155640 RepID=A0ACC1X829_MELAZ|nr:hypothetical protein OWV82_021103 [Melia azedarach]
MCICNKKAAVKISESRDNPKKPFYCCKYDECLYFKLWSPSENDFDSGAQLVGDVNAEIATNDMLKALRMLTNEINALVKRMQCICNQSGDGWLAGHNIQNLQTPLGIETSQK